MTEPMQALTDEGVAVWADSIARDWLAEGELRRLISDRSVVGVTSNPTIFQGAMSGGTAYTDHLGVAAREGLPATEIFERLALADIAEAAKQLLPVHQASGGRDGYVSYEVAPDIARDTDATAAEAARLAKTLDVPNLMIKIPATVEGLPAIRASIAAGISVNVTLIFSIARYRQVVEAFLAGLEDRVAAGERLDGVASVASFFVSRVDVLVDPLLHAIVEEGGATAELAKSRIGTAAIDNAKLAYQAWQELFSGPRWDALAANGATPQRCLWASTSTKNPEYRDVVYCEELIGRDTVNTMPLATIEAFADHGVVRGQTVIDDLARAQTLWSDLRELGIPEEQVGEQLEHEGLEKFADSFTALLGVVEEARARELT